MLWHEEGSQDVLPSWHEAVPWTPNRDSPQEVAILLHLGVKEEEETVYSFLIS